jgi:hypothetical protein
MFHSRKIGEIDITRHADDPGGKQTWKEEEKNSNTEVVEIVVDHKLSISFSAEELMKINVPDQKTYIKA